MKNSETVEALDWREMLFAATTEVFSIMVGLPIARAELAPPKTQNVTGTIGIAGAIRALLTLRCSFTSATRIASAMLAAPVEQAAAQSADAIGEICNMVAGHFKTKIGHEADCMLSVPIVILGSDYQVHHVPHHGEHLRLPLVFEGEFLEIILEVRK